MAGCGCSNDIWVTAAFRSVRNKEYYVFMKKEYVLYHCTQGTAADERILKGPSRITDDFPSLKCTIFEDVGVDGAFRSHNASKAFIFAANQVAELDYAPYGGCGQVVRGPMPIVEMFPFLRCTVFENGVDTAFDTANPFEAYIFKGDQYACIKYGTASPKVLNKGPIREHFLALRGTIFETGFDAAYYLHETQNEAYLFKGDTYCRLKFNPGTTNNQITYGPNKIMNGRPKLGAILPRKKNLNTSTN